MDGWMDRSVDWLFDGSVDWLVGLTKNDSLLFITDSWKRNHQSWKTLSADVNTWLAPCSPYRSMLSFHVPLVSTIITFFTCSYFHYLICRLVSAQEQMKCESHSSFSSLEVSNSPVFPQGESRVCSNLALQSFPWGECLCIGDNPLAHTYVFSLTPPPPPPPPSSSSGERSNWGWARLRLSQVTWWISYFSNGHLHTIDVDLAVSSFLSRSQWCLIFMRIRIVCYWHLVRCSTNCPPFHAQSLARKLIVPPSFLWFILYMYLSVCFFNSHH